MNRIGIAIVAAAAFVAASSPRPANAQVHGAEESYGSPHEMPTDDVPHPVSHDSASRAEELRVKGQCDKAVPILRRVLDNGGSEISQFNLGMCLLDLADAEHNAQHALAMRAEGADWIVRSANAGFAQAQSKAVLLYLDGVGVAADPVEAKKWALLYRHNVSRSIFGLPDIDNGVTGRLDIAVTGEKSAEARARANAWTKTPAASSE